MVEGETTNREGEDPMGRFSCFPPLETKDVPIDLRMDPLREAELHI
jgi:hypothetical protein